jgi:hypothetical protein
MGLFGGGEGTWSTHCAQDARFNLRGRAFGLFGGQKAIDDAIRAKQTELGLSDADVDKLTIETSFYKD